MTIWTAKLTVSQTQWTAKLTVSQTQWTAKLTGSQTQSHKSPTAKLTGSQTQSHKSSTAKLTGSQTQWTAKLTVSQMQWTAKLTVSQTQWTAKLTVSQTQSHKSPSQSTCHKPKLEQWLILLPSTSGSFSVRHSSNRCSWCQVLFSENINHFSVLTVRTSPDGLVVQAGYIFHRKQHSLVLLGWVFSQAKATLTGLLLV